MENTMTVANLIGFILIAVRVILTEEHIVRDLARAYLRSDAMREVIPYGHIEGIERPRRDPKLNFVIDDVEFVTLIELSN